jgi:hypothetical protein
MREYFIDEPTDIEGDAKQEALDLIRFNVEQILDHADEFTIVDEAINDVTLDEIDDYLCMMTYENPSFRQDVEMVRCFIYSMDDFGKLCEYTNVTGIERPKRWNQKVYFIESNDSAVTIIPIETGNKTVNIYMEPLESCPDFLTEMWAEHRDLHASN